MDGPRTPTIPTTELWDKIHELCDELESPPTSPIPSTIHLLRTSTRIYGSTSSVQVMDRSHDDGLEERAPSEHAPVDPNDPNTTQPPSYGPPSPPCYAVGTTHPSWIEITHVSDDPIWNPTNPCLDAEADSPPPQSPSSPSPSSSGDSEASQPNENDTFDRWQRSQSCAPFPSELSPLEETLQSRTSSFTPTPTAAQVAEDAAWDGVGRLLQAELEAGRWVRLSERPSSSSPYASDITASSTVDDETVDRWYSHFCPPIEEPMDLYTPDSPDEYRDDDDLEEEPRQPTRSRTTGHHQPTSQYCNPPASGRLPPEVLNRIFLLLRSNNPLRFVRCDMSRVALVCQAWRVEAERVLYTSVALRGLNKAQRFVDSRQAVTRVKYLVLDSDRKLKGRNLASFRGAAEVLCRCRGLETLIMRGYRGVPKTFFDMSELTKLTSLTLKDCDFHFDRDSPPFPYDRSPPPAFFANLTHLTLEYIVPYTSSVIIPILSAASPSLTSLSLNLGRPLSNDSITDYDRWPLPDFEKLVTLTLSGEVGDAFWFLEHCVALHAIHFKSDSTDPLQALFDLSDDARILSLSFPTFILSLDDDWEEVFGLECMKRIQLITLTGVDDFLRAAQYHPEYSQPAHIRAWKEAFEDFGAESEKKEGLELEGDVRGEQGGGMARLRRIRG